MIATNTFFISRSTGEVEIDRLALGVPYQDKSNIARWSHTGGGDRRCRGNTWFIPYKTIQSRAKERPHPATFPVQLAEWCIQLHGVSRVRTMLDPFLGIGNSAVAAKNFGVKKFIGFEIDETYLAKARQRLRLVGEALCFPWNANSVPYRRLPSFSAVSPVRKSFEGSHQIAGQRPDPIENPIGQRLCVV